MKSRIPRALAPATFAALSCALAQAQESFVFSIDSGATSFVWGGTTDLGDIVPMPPTFTLQGTSELLLTSGGAPVGSGEFPGGGDAEVVPDLHGEIPNSIPGFPPLAVIDVTDLHFVLLSPSFPVDGGGAFATEIVAVATAGTLVFDPLVGDTVTTELAGLSSDPEPTNGTLTAAGPSLALALPVDVSFDFTDPGTGVSGSVFLTGVMHADFDCPAPQVYCTTSPNSVGAGALIGASGSTGIVANDLELSTAGLPAGQFGVFYYGPNQTNQPFGDGVRCVSGTTVRLTPVNSGTSGQVTYAFDHTAPPNVGQIEAGATRNFQFWYRDPAAGGAGFNFSDALEIFFCP